MSGEIARTTTFMLQRISVVLPYIFLFIAMTAVEATAIGNAFLSKYIPHVPHVPHITSTYRSDLHRKRHIQYFSLAAHTRHGIVEAVTIPNETWSPNDYYRVVTCSLAPSLPSER